MIHDLFPSSPLLAFLLKLALIPLVFMPLVSVIAMFCIWFERKVAAWIQSRNGPMHVGGWQGWAQSIADGLKLVFKEDLMPRAADPVLFKIAPYLAFAPVFAAMVALPFGPDFTFEARLDIGVLYILAVLAVEVMGVILAGWASGSKWSVYGAMREACQMVSYEVPMGLAIITGLLTAGTLHLVELSYLQSGGLSTWFAFHNPFNLLACLLFFIAALASNKRAPFDLPESESELVAGFHTEYSGLRFSFFFFAEYAGMFVLGAVMAALFLGGWNSPFGHYDPIYKLLGFEPFSASHAYFSGNLTHLPAQQRASVMGLSSPTALFLLNLYAAFWVITKAMIFIFIQMWIRWTLPRIRIDQVMHACVKVLLPASLVCLVGCAFWIWLIDAPLAAITSPADHKLARIAGDTTALQIATQYVLASLAVALVVYLVGVALSAFLKRDQPQKSFFSALPVGPNETFMSGPDKPKP
jgi:NADH-quinone oxidoreductase subunit H